jgi:collagen alpha-1(XXV) chain (CLAC-P) (alzheimer disease amyloid- associated protein) (AMY) [contains: collagen-like alzheimer amyloid plaque component (CLAC)].
MADSTLTLKLDKDSIFNLLEGLRGPRGEKGEDGQRGERGEKGEQGLRGPKGESASAERAAELLKQKNVYLPDASVETVLAKLVELFGDSINVAYKPIEYIQPLVGQEFIDLRGEPHFKVSVDGGEKRVFESDNMRVPIEPFGVANILVKYYDLADREVGSAEIKGVEVHSNADDTFEENGVRYSLFGRKLEIDVTNFTGNNAFKVLGKWLVTQIDTILIKTSKNVNIAISETSFRDNNSNTIGDIPIVVEKPQNVTFNNDYKFRFPIKIGTLQYGVDDVMFDHTQVAWYDLEHKYISSGDPVDDL